MRGQRIPKVFEQDKGLRRFTGNSASGRAESSATLKLSYSAVLVRRWPLLAPMLCTPTAWASESSDRRFDVARDRTASLGYRAACLQAARTPRAPSGLESAMIPRGVAASLERTGGKSFAVNMQRMRDMRSEGRMRAYGILSADWPAREKSGHGLDRRFRGRPAASRACSLHSSPAATLDSAARSAELSKYGRKAELSSAAGRRRFCSATRIYSCCGEPSYPPGERKASLCTSR